MNAHVGKPFDLHVLVNTLLEVTGHTVPEDSPPTQGAPLTAMGRTVGRSLLEVEVAVSRMGGLNKLYVRAAKDFLRSLPEQQQALRQAASNDTAQCEMLAHTLKGTAALLGALALSDQAAQLERHCKAQRPASERASLLEQLDTLAAATTVLMQQAVTKLEPVGNPAEPAYASQAPFDQAALQAALDQLVPQLRDSNLSALDTLARLRPTFAGLPGTLLQPLEEALQALELEQALQACQQIQEWLQPTANKVG
jgi:HPt (histidine-containing phosphotransfer) domain-containing protein